MAARLEAAVCNREKVRLVVKCAAEKEQSPNDKSKVREEDEEREERILKPVEFLDDGKVESLKGFCNCWREFFPYLSLAISVESDVAERFQNLKLAKRLAVELINT